MGEYVDIGGVNTWYDEEGSGEPLVLLHGGLCTNETWAAQTPVFAERFRVVAPERRAHGHTADAEGPLTYGAMAEDTIGFLDKVVGGPAHLVGWSDGGIVGLMVAIARPDLVRKLVVIGANYDTTGVAPEVDDMFANLAPDSDEMAMFRGLYEMHTPDGPEHWPVVLAKFVEMTQREPHIPVGELAHISAPTLVVVGDDDMVSLEHTAALFRAIPNSELAVVPRTSHAVVIEKPELVNRIVLDFIENEPAETMLPIRRAATGAETP
ncbi:MAG: putative hydrolase or acyltransferase [Actinomycetia bacterium]|nr:putative hydrolase or acyltransferase [Actinomycetes bacterium]